MSETMDRYGRWHEYGGDGSGLPCDSEPHGEDVIAAMAGHPDRIGEWRKDLQAKTNAALWGRV